MPRRVKFEVYRVILPAGAAPFPDTLRRVGADDFQTRNIDRSDGFLRLQELRQEGAHWLCAMIRGRLEELPLRTDRAGLAEPLALAATEGLGEETSFLFTPQHSVLILQVNRDGVRGGGLAEYFTRMAAVDVTLEPVVDPEVLRRLGGMELIRSLEFKVAAGNNLEADRRANRTFRDAADLMDRFNGVQIDVLLNRGHHRGLLNSARVRSFITSALQLRRRDQREVTKLRIGGREAEGAPYEVLDLIEHRIVVTRPVEVVNRRIDRESCWAALRQVHERVAPRIEERFRPARRR